MGKKAIINKTWSTTNVAKEQKHTDPLKVLTKVDEHLHPGQQAVLLLSL